MPVKGEFGLKKGIDLHGAINELPGKIYLELRDKLNTNPEDKDWRALAAAVEKKYKIDNTTIASWLQTGSAAGKLLTQLSSQGMTVKELAYYLDTIEIDTCTLGLSPPADINIIKTPPTELEVFEGDPLVIEIDATGRPFPKYQWYFCQNVEDDYKKLRGRTEKVLRINDATTGNAGTYACQISNHRDPRRTKLTDHIVVSVIPKPMPHNSGLNPPNRDDVEYNQNTIYNQNGLASSSSNDFNQVLNKRCSSPSASLILGHPRDVLVGMNEPFVLSVQTTGNSPITYQWYRNGLKLQGQVCPKLRVQHASVLDFAKYYCLVSNGYKTEQSNTASVTEKFPKPERNVEIVIVSQPKSVCVTFGGSVLFSCEARCCEPLKYQWFKDGKPLQGEVSSDMKFMNIQDRIMEGFYQCEIFVDRRNENMPRMMTVGAWLKVKIPDVKDNIEYNPSDKVALLIGNSDYKCHKRLNGASIDIRMLAESFRALDFRVVSLLNLTKSEMENAVLHFIDLLGKNVYAVFYFCGHGFEEHGMSYLIPSDGPTGSTAKECVCAQEILANIQKKEPPVIFMILDICREKPAISSPTVEQIVPKTERGNTVFCYATSVGLGAFETRHGGCLVKHLLPLLRRKIGIDALVSDVKGEFARFQRDNNLYPQIPELVSNLLENQRSLTDKISKKGQTETFQVRDMIWNAAHEKPEKQIIHFEEVGALIELDFQAEFSNVLRIFTSVIDHGTTQDCVGKITNFSPPVSQQGKVEVSKKGTRVVSKISLQDIQKLKENLIVDVTIIFFKDNTRHFLQKRVNLGQPLVAKLRLWEQSHHFTPNLREAVQQDEECD